MATRPQAVGTTQIDEARLRVTEWRFAPGAETGRHVHGLDYAVVPMTSGALTIEWPDGSVTHPQLTAGVSYARPAGVDHNVINDNPFEFVFIEIELK
ncbi:MAG TPA: cupin domain-containing protein [Alphaproteobacteria bacterium]|nr:cupin domain-containing protein [Alphaproteobacteria bacterium]